jgi:Uma2 family endonuclease
MSTAAQPAIDLPPVQNWKDLLEDLLPPQGEWSREEYLTLTDHRSRLVEFTDGFLEVLPMPTVKHQLLVKFLSFAFSQFFDARGGMVLFAPVRMQVRDGKFREPDLLLLLSATDNRGQDRYLLGADLVVEVVSEDKPERDLVDKRADYAEAGVPEYWIVNPMDETISVLRLRDSAYEDAGIYRRGESAKSVLRPEFSITVSNAFDAARRTPDGTTQP